MSIAPTTLPDQKTIGMVSLGCPKALVDSERILTRLRADGYAFAEDYAGADVVLVNTCGFLDSAKEESLAAIGEAIAENGRVIVTGCMGEEADAIRAAHPQVLAITGGAVTPRAAVVDRWRSTLFLKDASLNARGWLLAVMRAVEATAASKRGERPNLAQLPAAGAPE